MLALTCCKHDGAGTASGGPQAARATSPAIAELLAAVPGDAAALGFIDLTEAPWSMITGGALVPLDESTHQALDKELREYVDRYLGLDLSKLQFAVGFVSGPPLHTAVLLKTVGGTPKLPGASDYEGGKVWLVDPERHLSLAIHADVVVFGEDAAVREVLETQAGKRKAVTADNKALVDWLRAQSSGAVLAFAAARPKALPLPPPIAGLERFAVTVGGRGITAVVDGDDPSISALLAQSDQAFATMLAQVDKAHAAAQAGTVNPLEGAMAIIGAAYARSYATRLKPRRTGNRLSASLDLGLAATGSTFATSTDPESWESPRAGRGLRLSSRSTPCPLRSSPIAPRRWSPGRRRGRRRRCPRPTPIARSRPTASAPTIPSATSRSASTLAAAWAACCARSTAGSAARSR